jgi:hypothetical protein
MLRFEGLVDVLVEFLVGTGGFRRVEIAAACDVAVWCVEVQRVGNDVELGK